MIKLKLQPVVAAIAFTFTLFLSACGEAPRIPDDKEFNFDEPTQVDEDPNQTLSDLIESHGFSSREVGVALSDNDGKLFESYSAKNPFIVASTTKYLTALYANSTHLSMDSVGAEVWITGTARRGTLRGNLYLKGHGDRELNQAKLFELAQQIKGAGIRRIRGQIVIDNTLFTPSQEVSPIFDEDATYNQGVAAVSFDNNIIEVSFTKTRNKWQQKPKFNNKNIRFKIGKNFDDANEPHRWSQLENGKTQWEVNPLWLKEQKSPVKLRLPLKNPARFVSQEFFTALRQAGVRGGRLSFNSVPSNAKRLAAIKKAPFEKRLISLLHQSNNVEAEILAIQATQKVNASFRGDHLAASSYLLKFVSDLLLPTSEEISLQNSSGLTPYNTITASYFARLLETVESIEGPGQAPLYEALHTIDIPEEPSHLSRACNKVYSKSGYLHFVRGLVGYFCDKEGGLKSFAIFVNDPEKRAILNEGRSHPEYANTAEEAAEWAARSHTLRSDILRFLIDRY